MCEVVVLRVAIVFENTLGSVFVDDSGGVRLLWREGVVDILSYLSNRFELVLWTDLSDEVLDALKVDGFFRYFSGLVGGAGFKGEFKDVRALGFDWFVDGGGRQRELAREVGLEGHYITIPPVVSEIPMAVKPLFWVDYLKGKLMRRPYVRPDMSVQNKCLKMLMHYSYLEIRDLVGRGGEKERLIDLVDILHNLPMMIDNEKFDWDMLRGELEYHKEVYDSSFDYGLVLDGFLYGDGC